MRCYSLALTILSLAAIGIHASPDDGGHDNDDDSNSSTASTTPTPTSVASATSSGSTGDSVCSSLMCISAVVNSSTVEYTLQSLGQLTLGWMAMGFGSTMANSPMVIMWPNSDGSLTLSQRMAPMEVMPTVVASPPRTATAQPSLSSLSGSMPQFVYTIPANSDTQQHIIWAFGSTPPDDPSVDAVLTMHAQSGTLTLDLTKSLSSGTPTPTPGSNNNVSIPLLPYQKLAVAHGILCTIGFLGLLPLGALLARYFRTFTPRWFHGHWVIQAALGGPVIVVGVACGFAAVHQEGLDMPDTHKRLGIALFVLYLVQLVFGAVIHFIKPTSATKHGRRPPHNYAHAVFGLLIIALAYWQVRLGYRTEWPLTTGRAPVPNGANILWIVWVVIIPVAYLAGLALLPRQYRQESSARKTAAQYGQESDVSLQDRNEMRMSS